MLTDTAIKKAKADGKPRKIFDAHGLFLFVTQGTDGDTHKRWRLKFTYHKKEKLLALGVYPAMTLAEARKRRDKARALLEQGIALPPSARPKSGKRLSGWVTPSVPLRTIGSTRSKQVGRRGMPLTLGNSSTVS